MTAPTETLRLLFQTEMTRRMTMRPEDRPSLQEEFERKYDGLGPTDFAKEVIQFGDRLGREGKNLTRAEKGRALAEYSFLQDRLSFWLWYEYKPVASQGHLLSAALTLFQGAVSAGIAGPGRIPNSMIAVAGAAMAFDSAPPRLRSATPNVESGPSAQRIISPDVEGLGGTVDNSKVKIDWKKGIVDQGDPFEDYVGEQIPDAAELAPTSKTFDGFNPITREATSVKTLNTLSVSYIKIPQRIYWRMARYIDSAADYEPRVDSDLDAAEIDSKTIHLAIPEYTSPTQWRYLLKAVIYGKTRGVSIVITRIRE